MPSKAVITPQMADEMAKLITGLPIPFTLTWKDGASRTLSQNAQLHVWFAEVADWRGDMTALDVKGECHRDLALHIKLRDAQFAWIWEKTGARLSPEKQAKFLASEHVAVSSTMTTKELGEYMDEMVRHYAGLGLQLVSA